jgi:competence protein ComEC
MRALVSLFIFALIGSLPAAAEKPLQIFFVDVEGGQATLFVAPSGQSLLVDTGWPGHSYRDALRISKAAKLAGIKKIDYVLVTHFHEDHVGGVPQLVEKIPVGTFIDHGESVETGNRAKHLYEDYRKAIANAQRIIPKPGEKIAIKGLDVTVVSANGDVITSPFVEGGAPNPLCSGNIAKEVDTSENARSIGTYYRFGKFRAIDLGDLTWNKEFLLACPSMKVAPVDVYIVTHHGADLSSNPVLVKSLGFRAAIMDNGAKKGGAASTVDTIRSSPGFEDLWQLHFGDEGGKEHNAPDAFIANVDENETTDYYLKLTAWEDGSFEVYNARNKQSKKYAAR